MIPVSVRLRGFMSYREPQELHFDDDVLWVLEGPNGVGKSTIFDAITFALYGQHRLGKQHNDDLINHDSDSLEVELVMRLSDETYKLSRTVPRSGRPTFQIGKRTPDGRFVPVSGTEQREGYLTWVQEHLGMDYDAFTASVLLLQGESEKLIRTEPEKRRKVLARLIDLTRYEQLHKRARDHEEDHKREAARLAQRLAAMREIGEVDEQATAALFAAAEEDRERLNRAVEELREVLPAAERRERLLAEQDALSRSHAEEQELLLRAEEIRAAAEELDALEPILPPLRDAVRERQVLAEADAAATAGDAQVKAAEVEEQDAAAAERAAQERAVECERRAEESRRRCDELGAERDKLMPVQERWNAAEEMRRRQAELSAELAALPALDSDGAEEALAAARRALKGRQTEAAQARAERKLVADRLERLERLTGDMLQEVPCSLCGQTITVEHAAAERARLEEARTRFEAAIDAAEQDHKDAEQALSRAQHEREAALARVERRKLLEQELRRSEEGLARQMQGLTREDALAAVRRLSELAPLLAAAKQDLTAQQDAPREARKEAASASERVRKAEAARRALERGLAAAQGKRQQALGKLSVLRERLPEPLRDAGPEQARATEDRVAALQPYRRLAARLRAAEAGETGRRIAEIGRLLEEIPEAARRPAAELRAALDEKRRARDEAQGACDQRAADLARLRVERRQRAEVVEELRAAEQEQRLYGILVGLLGPEDLQRRLVRDAEQAIVDLANQELDGLTHGRLRLTLRPGKDGEDGAQKALDLLVHNRELTEQSMALGLASGSQKFRIAISLALAIGRYLARETRRVESVIIDEGFGCLDRAGREDAVAVLRELSGHLARVILVSHQEEFYGRFKSAYRIDLVERSSVPKRITR